MGKKQKLVLGVLLSIAIVLAFYLLTWFTAVIELGNTMAEFDNPPTNSNQTTMEITFANKQYTLSPTPPNQVSLSRDWVLSNETPENYTSLLSTNQDGDSTNPQTVSGAQQTLEGILINMGIIKPDQILESTVIESGNSPQTPSHLLVYYLESDEAEHQGTHKFIMQKIVQLDADTVGSIIYTERFPIKSKSDIEVYYESDIATNKKVELINLSFPLN